MIDVKYYEDNRNLLSKGGCPHQCGINLLIHYLNSFLPSMFAKGKAYECFSYVEITGNEYEQGFQIGKLFEEDMKQYAQLAKEKITNLNIKKIFVFNLAKFF